ncbi:MAG: hypothetical protein ACJ8AD_20845 [Gemmatimonadaceae bacterium]
MQSTAVTVLLLSASLGTGGATLLRAQRPATADPRCDGKRVSRIDIRPGRPPFEGSMSRWRFAARAAGLHHATTRPAVIEAFMALHEGEVCTELRRAESERVLRAQPFLANASVRAIPDDAGGVAILVETVDEVPVLVNGHFRGLSPRALSLGNSNVGGQGLLVQLSAERGDAYPNGFGARIVEQATFGRPYVTSFEGYRFTVGHRIVAQMAHPFYTDLQRIGWNAGFETGNQYPRLRRPADDNLALLVRETRWQGSGLARVFGTRTMFFVGGGVTGIKLDPAQAGVIVSDTGLAIDTGTTLRNRYAPFKAGRLGVLGGLARIRFRTVQGFDALTAAQDVANGALGGVFAAKGLSAFGENDVFLSSVVYAGTSTERMRLATSVEAEARHGPGAAQWDDLIGSSRTALYLGGGPGFLFVLDDRLSGGRRALIPLQLALGDRQGGIMGYNASQLVGAYRNVARADLRWSRPRMVRNADVGFATFTQVGSIWAGDAPYGSTTTRTSGGVSILAAYPTGSKRLYRVDVGIPLARGGGGKFEVRFSSEDATQRFWREPDDVLRSRIGGLPSTMFSLPVR